MHLPVLGQAIHSPSASDPLRQAPSPSQHSLITPARTSTERLGASPNFIRAKPLPRNSRRQVSCRAPPAQLLEARLFFDVPWCADIILSQIQTAQRNRTGKGRVQFNRLLRFLREFYTSPGQDHDVEDLGFRGLRNRRRIWMNCERIVREMDNRSLTVGRQSPPEE